MGWINRRTVGWTAGILLLAIVVAYLLLLRSLDIYYRGKRGESDARNLRNAILAEVERTGQWPPSTTDASGQEVASGPPLLARLLEENVRSDPGSTKGENLRWYACDGFGIVVSVGPDGILEITPPMIEGLTPDKVEARLSAITYDPTNGTGSPGDVWLLVVPETKR